MKIFAPPLQWDKAIDGPDAAASSRWQQEFKRSQLPPDTIFPEPGQIWRARHDCVVNFVATIKLKDSHPTKTYDLTEGEIIIWFAPERLFLPFSFGPARLMEGQKVRIVDRNDFTDKSCDKPLVVNFRTLRHKELEKDIVSQKLRDRPEYQDYALQIATARPRACLSPEATYLNEDFELVEDVV